MSRGHSVAIYTRKSTEEGLEQPFNSRHTQRRACEDYTRSQAGEGWVISTSQYDSGYFTYIITTRRITSGEELKERK